GGGQLAFSQSDPQAGRALSWTQQMDVLVGTAAGSQTLPVALDGPRADVKDFARIAHPTFVLPTGGGIAYGDFTLDDASRAYLLRHLPELKDPVSRGAAWVTLWEELLGKR